MYNLDQFMIAYEFSQNVFYSYVYMKKKNNKIFNFIIQLLYVDNMLILAKNQSNVDICKNYFKSTFKNNDLDKSKSILGLNIHRNLVKKSL